MVGSPATLGTRIVDVSDRDAIDYCLTREAGGVQPAKQSQQTGKVTGFTLAFVVEVEES